METENEVDITKVNLDINVSQACRTCMNKTNDLTPIFLEYNETQQSLSQVLLYITGLKVVENDGLPDHICNSCLTMAECALQFKEMCYRSDVCFRKNLNIGNNTTKTFIKKECESFTHDESGTFQFNKENVHDTDNNCTNGTKSSSIVQGLYQCALCSDSFVLCNKLKEHVKNYHIDQLNMTKSENKYSCTRCSKSFRSKKGCSSHNKRCQSKEDKKTKVKQEIVSDSDSDTPLAEKFDTRQSQSSPSEDKYDVQVSSVPDKFDENSMKDSLQDEKSFTDFNQVNDDDFYADIDVDYTEFKIESEGTSNDNVKPHKKNEKKYSCDECNLTLTKSLYEAHMQFVHPTYKKPGKKRGRKVITINGEVCDVMPREGSDSEAIPSTAQHKCTHCERKFSKLSSLNAHIKKHEKQMNEVHKCDTCKREFKRRAHLENHMLTHSVDKGFQCSLCPKAFARQESLNVHLANHKSSKKHQCNFCEKGFNMLSTLKDHIRTHTGEKPFLCSICGRGFSQSTNLKEHVRRHQGYKPFKCNFCSQTFVSKGELEAHTRKHSGAHPFVCDECGGGFTTSSSLVKHKRIHSGERPYQCDFCPMKFTALGTLKNHRRTHTGEKPYKCQYCDKAFAQKNDLVSHTRTHTGERPYICSVCGHAFRQSSALKTHLKIHGGQGEMVMPMDVGVMKLNDQVVGQIKINDQVGAGMKLAEQMEMVNRSPMDDTSSSMNLMTPKSENSHQ